MFSSRGRSRDQVGRKGGKQRRRVWAYFIAVVMLLGSIGGSVASAAQEKQAAHAANAAHESAMSWGTQAPTQVSLSRQQVHVPTSMRSSPFNVPRYLYVPSGYTVSVYARVPDARFILRLPNSDILVSQPDNGKISLIRPGHTYTFASGLWKPHDMVLHKIGSTTYLYVAATDRIYRYTYHNGDTYGHSRSTVISNLPTDLAHPLKNIAFGRDGKLYLSIGSSCNACTSDTTNNPVLGSIYQYNANGSGRTLWVRGVRNAEGLAFEPGTNWMWAVVNNRDDIACPYTGNGCTKGQVVQSYVNNHPPDEFVNVHKGRDFGWPFCNPNPDSANGLNNMPFQRDYELNANGHVRCSTKSRVQKGIPAHSAPLGIIFLQASAIRPTYRNGALVALHGSWDRHPPRGPKVVYFPWYNTSHRPGTQQNFVTGWLTNGSYWGRPVDIAIGTRGAIYISDDQSGTIYRIARS